MEENVTLIWLGALLILAGVVVTAMPPILQGRFSRLRRLGTTRPSNTLEPERPARGFDPQASWPGLAMIVLGAILLLAGAAF
jgi:drug/metabolite transporter (DMT)-like permease